MESVFVGKINEKLVVKFNSTHSDCKLYSDSAPGMTPLNGPSTGQEAQILVRNIDRGSKHLVACCHDKVPHLRLGLRSRQQKQSKAQHDVFIMNINDKLSAKRVEGIIVIENFTVWHYT